MARHDSITYRWRWTRIPTPRALDLHPVVDRWEGPRWLVVACYHFWRICVRPDRAEVSR